MKLELKHLAPYLPYALKCRVTDLNRITTSEMHSVYSDGSCTFHDLIESEQAFSDIKPILRPLSDFGEHYDLLKKEVYEPDNVGVNLFLIETFNGIKVEVEYEFDRMVKERKSVPYNLYAKLFELHFDIFALIEKGLAVSIHDVG